MNFRVSEATEKLLASLYKSDSFWRRLVSFDAQLKVIAEIESTGEPGAIADLLPIVITQSRTAVQAAAMAIHKLLQCLDADDYPQFDEWARQSSPNWQARRSPWYSMKPADVAHLAGLQEVSMSLLGIASGHANGRIREAAVRHLARSNRGAELPFLLLRANDWVAEIRLLAKDLLATRIRPDYARYFLMWLPLVLRLNQARRCDHSPMIKSILGLLRSSEAAPALQEGFGSPSRAIRRFCYETALKEAHHDIALVVRSAQAEPDPRIRLVAAVALRTLPPSDVQQILLARARKDSFASVRHQSLRIYAERYPDRARAEFRAALLDSNASIREAAQTFLRTEAGFDLRSFYGQALGLPNGAEIAGAILGLGETGIVDDGVVIERFVSDTRPRIRRSALRALARLRPTAFLKVFLAALEDSSGSVATEARAALAQFATSVGGKRLWEIFEQCEFSHGRRATLFLLARLGKWDSISLLVQALGDRDESVAAQAGRYISRWMVRYNRVFATPTREQMISLRNALGRYDLLVGRNLRRELESMMKSFETA